MKVCLLLLWAIVGVSCADTRQNFTRLQVAHCGRICGQQSSRIPEPNLPRLQQNIFNGLVQNRKTDTRKWVRNPTQERTVACLRKCLNSRSPGKAQSKVRRLRRETGNPVTQNPECPGVGPSPGVIQNTSVSHERLAPGVNLSAHWTIVVRWSPLQIPSEPNGSVVNWTGYSVLWFTPDLMSSENHMTVPCRKVPKNQTTIRITEEDGWVFPHTIQLVVTTFPTAPQDIDFQEYNFDEVITPTSPVTTPATSQALNTTATAQVTPLITPKQSFSQSSGDYLTPGHIGAICAGLIGGVVLVTSLLVYIRHMTNKRSKSTQPLSEAEVFVSYSRANCKWVDENLLRLMDHNSISYLIDYKDFEPGRPWLENLVDCIRRSHKLLIIMSREYMSRSNCLAELQQAMYWAREPGRTLIVVRINNISKDALPCPIRNRTFIDYADRIERQTWKRRLVRVLKASRSASELRSAQVSSHCSTVSTAINEVDV